MLKNGTIWKDDCGNAIQAHGGCILWHQGKWYWYGEHKGAGNVPGTTRVDVVGISCYSSKDLLSWHYEGLALEADRKDSKSLLAPSGVCERPKVIFHAGTGQFVMWMHLDSADYVAACTGVAVAKRPEGPFELVRTMQPNRQDSRDMTLFEDADGSRWLIHSADWNKTLDIARLTEDATDVDGFYVSVLKDQEREAPVVFWENGVYYMITSGCTGWEPNSALYAQSRFLTGQWKLIDNPCEGSDYRKTFYGQSADVFEAGGRHFLLLDHWKPETLADSGYSILPIEIKDGIMHIKWRDYFYGVEER